MQVHGSRDRKIMSRIFEVIDNYWLSEHNRIPCSSELYGGFIPFKVNEFFKACKNVLIYVSNRIRLQA